MDAKYKDGLTFKWLTVKSLISLDQVVTTYKIFYDHCPENLRHTLTEYDPRFQSIEADIGQICKFPQLD